MDARQKLDLLQQKAEVRRANLKRWMEDNKLLQTDVADRMGVGRSYISLLFKRSFGENAARNMEQALNMPNRYLDSDANAPESMDTWGDISDLRSGVSGTVRRVDLALGDDGTLLEVQHNLPPVAISRDLLAARGVRHRTNLAFVVVRGEAMAPYLGDGDIALVDRAQSVVTEGMVCAMAYGKTLIVRRVRPAIDGGLILISDNPRFAEERLSATDAAMIKIVGRVIWRAG